MQFHSNAPVSMWSIIFEHFMSCVFFDFSCWQLPFQDNFLAYLTSQRTQPFINTNQQMWQMKPLSVFPHQTHNDLICIYTCHSSPRTQLPEKIFVNFNGFFSNRSVAKVEIYGLKLIPNQTGFPQIDSYVSGSSDVNHLLKGIYI